MDDIGFFDGLLVSYERCQQDAIVVSGLQRTFNAIYDDCYELLSMCEVFERESDFFHHDSIVSVSSQRVVFRSIESVVCF